MFLIFYVIRNIPEFDRYWETRLKNSNSHQSIKAVPPPKIIKISLNYFKFKMFLESCMIMIYLYDNLVYVNWLTRKNSYIFKLFFSSPIPFSGILTIKVERVLLPWHVQNLSVYTLNLSLFISFYFITELFNSRTKRHQLQHQSVVTFTSK